MRVGEQIADGAGAARAASAESRQTLGILIYAANLSAMRERQGHDDFHERN